MDMPTNPRRTHRLTAALATLLCTGVAQAEPLTPWPELPPLHPSDGPELLQAAHGGALRASPQRGGSSVSLQLAVASLAEGRREFGGMLLVELPTSGWLSGPRKAKEAPAGERPTGRRSAGQTPPTVDGERPLEPTTRAAHESDSSADSAPVGHEARAGDALACNDHTTLPRIGSKDARQAVRAALRAMRARGAGRRLDDLSSRARWSAALPTVRFRVTRLVDESLSLSPTSYDPHRTTSSGGASLWLEARATWHLDRGLFASEEVRIERLREQLEQRRDRHQQLVLELLFAWQAAALALLDPATPPAQQRKAWVLEQQRAAELDLYTAGWFTRWLRRNGTARPSGSCDPAPLDPP